MHDDRDTYRGMDRETHERGGGTGLLEPPVRRPQPKRSEKRISVPIGPDMPSVWWRLVQLTLRPESWAEALRHPLRYTLAPLVLAIVLVSAVSGVFTGIKAVRVSRMFAAAYDANYPAMKFENGVLTALPSGGRHPISIYVPQMLSNGADAMITIDPTGHTQLSDLSGTTALLVTDKEIIQRSPLWESHRPLKDFFPLAQGQAVTIDGSFLTGAVHHYGWVLAGGVGLAVFVQTLVVNVLWAALVGFLVSPVVVLSALALRIPRQVSYRASAAVCVPLVMLGGILTALGVSPSQTIPLDYVPIFWFVAAVLLAAWTGLLAGRLFSKRKPRRGM